MEAEGANTAFLFSQMSIKNFKVWVKMSEEYFVSNWGCGKYAVFNRNALVSLFLERGPTNEKNPLKIQHT